MVAKGSPSDGDSEGTKKVLVDAIKNDFFEQDNRIVLTIYIKNLEHDHTEVQFNESSILITFKTRDISFLKQYKTDKSADVLFEWNVELTNKIDVMESKFKINMSTMELTLRKHATALGKWTNVIKGKEEKNAQQPNVKCEGKFMF